MITIFEYWTPSAFEKYGVYYHRREFRKSFGFHERFFVRRKRVCLSREFWVLGLQLEYLNFNYRPV